MAFVLGMKLGCETKNSNGCAIQNNALSGYTWIFRLKKAEKHQIER